MQACQRRRVGFGCHEGGRTLIDAGAAAMYIAQLNCPKDLVSLPRTAANP